MAYRQYRAVRKEEVIITSLFLAITGAVFLFMSFLSFIPLKLGLPISLSLFVISGLSFLVFKMKSVEPLKNLEQKIPYLYLFMEIYLLSGLSAQEGLKKSAILLEDPVLYRLYRHLQAGIPYEEAIKKIFGNYKGPSRLHVSNLLHSALFGTGGMVFLKETMEYLIAEKGKDIEKVTEELKILTEIYTILGVFGPLIGLASIAALLAFGGVKGLNIDVMAGGIIVIALISMAFIVVLAQSMIQKVKI
ncbi:MAG: hypothetical protein GSR76_03535 [Desulfurococcales archaeon]|nr:hypothetical protein [Desulfurococcales archaeon]